MTFTTSVKTWRQTSRCILAMNITYFDNNVIPGTAMASHVECLAQVLSKILHFQVFMDENVVITVTKLDGRNALTLVLVEVSVFKDEEVWYFGVVLRVLC